MLKVGTILATLANLARMVFWLLLVFVFVSPWLAGRYVA
jgi:hypothetical protein